MSERIRAIGAIREHGNILLFGKTPKQKRVVTDNVIATIFRDIATPRLIEQQKRLERAKTLSNQTYYYLPAILLAKHLFTPNDVGKSFLWGGHAASRHVVDSCVSIDERRVNFAYLGHGRIKVEVAIVNTLKYEYA